MGFMCMHCMAGRGSMRVVFTKYRDAVCISGRLGHRQWIDVDRDAHFSSRRHS